MKVTLWGQRAAAFNTDVVNVGAEDKPIVVMFVGGLVKSYQGTRDSICLSSFVTFCYRCLKMFVLPGTHIGTYYLSANTVSRWYFNPPIPEAHQFYSR